MRKNINKTKKYRDKFRSGNRFLNWKILNYFNEIWNWNFSTYSQILFEKGTFKSDIIFCWSKNIKGFQWLSKSKFSSLWLKWMQKMKMKQNQPFFHETYSNLTSYIFYQIIKYFNDIQNRNFTVSWLNWTQT